MFRSALSRLESGQREPAPEPLLPLAKAQGVWLDELIGAPPTVLPRARSRPFTRSGRTFVPLTRHLGGLQAYQQTISPRRVNDERPDQHAHEGAGGSVYCPAGCAWLWVTTDSC